MGKIRLDDLLVTRNLASDRRAAVALLMSGAVRVDGCTVDKPGTAVDEEAKVELRAQRRKYVSRGGLKLESALGAFEIDVTGLVCLDLGASTGGFTDCLLQHGAKRVFAYDVGRGQLDWNLRQDPRVIVRDNINARLLRPEDLPEKPDLVTLDLCFISLRSVLPALAALAPVRVIALVKPQYEAFRAELPPDGVIRVEALRTAIVERFRSDAAAAGWDVLAEAPSPIPGQKGNREHFLFLGRGL